MQVKVSLAPWFAIAVDILVRLSLMGYQVTQDDVDELIEDALVFEFE